MFRLALILSLTAVFVSCDALLNDALSTSVRSNDTVCPAVRECLTQLDKGETCDTLPVPRRATVDVLPTGFRLTKARDGIWIYEDFAYFALILYKGSRLAVLDFPEAANERGLPFITDAVIDIVGEKKPRRIDMVYSHAHYDHIGGGTAFFNWAKERYPAAKIFIWGTFETRRVIRASETKRAPIPNVIVRSRGRTLTLDDDLEVKMMLVGGHTRQDLALYIRPQKEAPGILMLIDIVFPRWAPFFNVAITDNVARAISVQREILALDFDIFIGGHLRIGSKGDVRESLRYYEDLIAAGQEGFVVDNEVLGSSEFGNIFDPSAREFGNLWFAFGVFRDLQVDTCARRMIKRWGCRIGGVDVVIRSHCFVAVTHVLVEV